MATALPQIAAQSRGEIGETASAAERRRARSPEAVGMGLPITTAATTAHFPPPNSSPNAALPEPEMQYFTHPQRLAVEVACDRAVQRELTVTALRPRGLWA